MGLLADIRSFVGNYVKNPLVIAGTAYLIWKLLNKKAESLKTEQANLLENIRVILKDDEYELILDDITGSYSVVDNHRGGVYPVKSPAEGKTTIKRLKTTKTSRVERLNRLRNSFKEGVKQDLVNFLKNNPNPNDTSVHNWAKEHGYETDEVEQVLYQLATSYVQNK